MNPLPTNTSYRSTWTYRVSDVPPMRAQYANYSFAPDTVVAQYVHDGTPEGRWELQSVGVFGPKLKKDGTHGATRGAVTYHSYRNVNGAFASGWILELLEDNGPKHPVGDVTRAEEAG